MKNRAAGGRVNVLMVSRNAEIANATDPRNTLREGDDYVRESVTKRVTFLGYHLFCRRGRVGQKPEIGGGEYEGHVGWEHALQR